MIKKYDTLKPTAFLICPKSLYTLIFWAATLQTLVLSPFKKNFYHKPYKFRTTVRICWLDNDWKSSVGLERKHSVV